MSDVATKEKNNLAQAEAPAAVRETGPALLKKEDWWAVWIGLAVVALSIILWLATGSAAVITARIPKWTDFGTLAAALGKNAGSIVLLFLIFLALFSLAAVFLNQRFLAFLPGFVSLFVLAVIINGFSAWSWANQYNLEAPLVALVLGLIISNLLTVPKWLEASLRTELYVKVGIVLLGATLPITLIVQAGPVVFLQATVIAVSTFLIIYFVATRWFHINPRFAATLGAGGSICGVSAAIAVGGSIKAKKEEVSVSISIVIIWAVFMIFFLSVVSKVLGLQPGPAGAWIGTSEFADAAGVTAASAVGDKALTTFTLMKVVGRDIFIGIWCFVLSLIAITKWEKREEGTSRVRGVDIWNRFPKFVLGFIVASVVLSLIIANVSPATAALVNTNVIAPIKEIRTWAFTLCFLSIGLTTRFKKLAVVGLKPLAAFSIGAVVNVVLGYIVSILVLGSFWAKL